MVLKKLDRKQLKENREEMYSEWLKRSKKKKESNVDIQTDLARKYGYKNHSVVQSLINRIEGKI